MITPRGPTLARLSFPNCNHFNCRNSIGSCFNAAQATVNVDLSLLEVALSLLEVKFIKAVEENGFVGPSTSTNTRRTDRILERHSVVLEWSIGPDLCTPGQGPAPWLGGDARHAHNPTPHRGSGFRWCYLLSLQAFEGCFAPPYNERRSLGANQFQDLDLSAR